VANALVTNQVDANRNARRRIDMADRTVATEADAPCREQQVRRPQGRPTALPVDRAARRRADAAA
jgi:hypothetical protein